MMKNAIRLLVLAGALMSVGVLAQSAQQNWNFTFPTYYYVYTNTTSVDFDFTATSVSSTVVYTGSHGQASLANLQACIDNAVSGLVGPGTEPVAQSSAPASPASLATCEFGPTSVTSSGYTVDWNGLGSADGSLLVVTNASSYKVTAYADSVPAGVTFKVAPKFGDAPPSHSDFVEIPVGSGSAVQIASDANDYYTQYRNIYVLPLTYAADVEPNADAIASTTTVVTYTAAAP